MTAQPRTPSMAASVLLFLALFCAVALCQDYCDDAGDCNDRGYCFNSTTCMCYLPFYGNQCEINGGEVSLTANGAHQTVLVEPCGSVTLSSSMSPNTGDYIDYRFTVLSDRTGGDTGAIRASIHYGTHPTYANNSGACDIDGCLVDANLARVIAQIPDMYAFDPSGSTAIVDGGDDMYDSGNNIDTNRGNNMFYFDQSITDGQYFGPNAIAINQIIDGLFVLTVRQMSVSYFDTDGDVGVGNSVYLDTFELDGFTLITRTTYGSNTPAVTKVILLPPDSYGVTDGSAGSDSITITSMSSADWMIYAVFGTYDETGTGTLPSEDTVRSVARALLETCGPWACNRLGYDCGGDGLVTSAPATNYYISFDAHPELDAPVVLRVGATVGPVVNDGVFNSTAEIGRGNFSSPHELHRTVALLPEYTERSVITATLTLSVPPLQPLRVYFDDNSTAGSGGCTAHTDYYCAVTECSYDIPPCAVSSAGSLHVALYSEANITAPLNYTLNVTTTATESSDLGSTDTTIPLTLWDDGTRNVVVHHFNVHRNAHSVAVAVSGVLGGTVTAYLNRAGMPVAGIGGGTEDCMEADFASCTTRTACEVYTTECDEEMVDLRDGDWYVAVVVDSQDDDSVPVTCNLRVEVLRPETVSVLSLGGAVSVVVPPHLPVAYFRLNVDDDTVASLRGLELTFFSDQGVGDAEFTVYYEYKGLPDADCENVVAWEAGAVTTTLILRSCELAAGNYYFAVVTDDPFYGSDLRITVTASQPALSTIPIDHHYTGYVRDGAAQYFLLDLPATPAPLAASSVEVTVEMRNGDGFVALSTEPVGDDSCCDNLISSTAYITAYGSDTVSLRTPCSYFGGPLYVVVASTFAGESSFALTAHVLTEDVSTATPLPVDEVTAFSGETDVSAVWAQFELNYNNTNGPVRIEFDFFAEEHGATATVRHSSSPLFGPDFHSDCGVDSEETWSCSTTTEACKIVVPECSVAEGIYYIHVATTEAFSLRPSLVETTAVTLSVPSVVQGATQTVPGDDAENTYRITIPNSISNGYRVLAVDVFAEDETAVNLAVDAILGGTGTGGGDCSSKDPVVSCVSAYYCRIRLNSCELGGSNRLTVVVHADGDDDSAWSPYTLSTYVINNPFLVEGVGVSGTVWAGETMYFRFDSATVSLGRFDSLAFTVGATTDGHDVSLYVLKDPGASQFAGPTTDCCTAYDDVCVSSSCSAVSYANCDVAPNSIHLLAVTADSDSGGRPVGFTLRADVVRPHSQGSLAAPATNGSYWPHSDLVKEGHVELYTLDVSHIPANGIVSIRVAATAGDLEFGFTTGSDVGLGSGERCSPPDHTVVTSGNAGELQFVNCDGTTAELVVFVYGTDEDVAGTAIGYTVTTFAAVPEAVDPGLDPGGASSSVAVAGSVHAGGLAMYTFNLSSVDPSAVVSFTIGSVNGSVTLRVNKGEVASDYGTCSATLSSIVGCGAVPCGSLEFGRDAADSCFFTGGVYHVTVEGESPAPGRSLAQFTLRLNVSDERAATELVSNVAYPGGRFTVPGQYEYFVFYPNGSQHATYNVVFEDLFNGTLAVYASYGGWADTACVDVDDTSITYDSALPLRRVACQDCGGAAFPPFSLRVVSTGVTAPETTYSITVETLEPFELRSGESHSYVITRDATRNYFLDMSAEWYPTVTAAVIENVGNIRIDYDADYLSCATAASNQPAFTLYTPCAHSDVTDKLWIEVLGRNTVSNYTLVYSVNSNSTNLTAGVPYTDTPPATGTDYSRYVITEPEGGWPEGASLEVFASGVNGTANVYFATANSCPAASCSLDVDGDTDCEFALDACDLDSTEFVLIYADGLDTNLTLEYSVNVPVALNVSDPAANGSLEWDSQDAAAYAHYVVNPAGSAPFVTVSLTAEGSSNVYVAFDSVVAGSACNYDFLNVNDGAAVFYFEPFDKPSHTLGITVGTGSSLNYSLSVTETGTVHNVSYGEALEGSVRAGAVFPSVYALDVTDYANRVVSSSASINVNVSWVDCPGLYAFAAVDYIPGPAYADYYEPAESGVFYQSIGLSVPVEDVAGASVLYVSVFGDSLTQDADYRVRWTVSGLDDGVTGTLFQWEPTFMDANDTYDLEIGDLTEAGYFDLVAVAAGSESVTLELLEGVDVASTATGTSEFSLGVTPVCGYDTSASLRVRVSGDATVTLQWFNVNPTQLVPGVTNEWADTGLIIGRAFTFTVDPTYDPAAKVHSVVVSGAEDAVAVLYGFDSVDWLCSPFGGLAFMSAQDFNDEDLLRGRVSFASSVGGRVIVWIVSVAPTNMTVGLEFKNANPTDLSAGATVCNSVWAQECKYYVLDPSSLGAHEWFEVSIEGNVDMYSLSGSIPSPDVNEDSFSGPVSGIEFCSDAYPVDTPVYLAVTHESSAAEEEFTLVVTVRSPASVLNATSGVELEVHIDDDAAIVLPGATSEFSYATLTTEGFGAAGYYGHDITVAFGGATASPGCFDDDSCSGYMCGETFCDVGPGDLAFYVDSSDPTQLEFTATVTNPEFVELTSGVPYTGTIEGAYGQKAFHVSDVTDSYTVTTVTLYGENVRLYVDPDTAHINCMAYDCVPSSGVCSIVFDDPCTRSEAANGYAIVVAEDDGQGEGACFELVVNVTREAASSVVTLSPGVTTGAVSPGETVYYELDSSANEYYYIETVATAYGTVSVDYTTDFELVGASCSYGGSPGVYVVFTTCGGLRDTVYAAVSFDAYDVFHSVGAVEYAITVLQVPFLTASSTTTFTGLTGPTIIRLSPNNPESINVEVDIHSYDIADDIVLSLTGPKPLCEDDVDGDTALVTVCRHGQQCSVKEKARAQANEAYERRWVVIAPETSLVNSNTETSYDVTITLGTDNCYNPPNNVLDYCRGHVGNSVWRGGGTAKLDARAEEYGAYLADQYAGCLTEGATNTSCVDAIAELACAALFEHCDADGFTHGTPSCLCSRVHGECAAPQTAALSYATELAYETCAPGDPTFRCGDPPSPETTTAWWNITSSLFTSSSSSGPLDQVKAEEDPGFFTEEVVLWGGIGVGALVLLLCVCVVAYCCCCRDGYDSSSYYSSSDDDYYSSYYEDSSEEDKARK